ncbi:hypothetical protein C806_00831 [Lachnospiraceae bacterium 3-1]|nr:hypothetical protein C806_00831 [Lachnospiraceae bacterium 3-1]
MERVKKMIQTSDIITLILGIASLVTACGTILLSFRYNKLVQGQVEMQIRERITNARIRYEDLTIQYNEELNNDLIISVFESAKEEFLNSYDEACQKYLDKKVDKERFKKSYFVEIQSIVKNDNFKEKYDSQSTDYKATVKVYNEWFNLEK